MGFVSILAKNFKTNCQKRQRMWSCGGQNAAGTGSNPELRSASCTSQGGLKRGCWVFDLYLWSFSICLKSRSEVIGLSIVKQNFLLQDDTNKIAAFMPSRVWTEPLASCANTSMQWCRYIQLGAVLYVCGCFPSDQVLCFRPWKVNFTATVLYWPRTLF